MIFRILICLVFCFHITCVKSQDINQPIVWKDKKLSWSDFKEKPGYDKYPYKLAKTNWKLDVVINDTSCSKDTNRVNIKITALFNPLQSWVRNPSISFRSLKLLVHEQLHFDIVELFARKMRKELLAATLTKTNYKIQASKIRDRLFRKLHTYQKNYDISTKYSNDDTEQSKWQERITNEIKSLDNFSSSCLSIKINCCTVE